MVMMMVITKIAPRANWQVDNNFPRSILLLTIEMMSKCSKLQKNHEPQASGFTADLVREKNACVKPARQ